MLAFIRFIAFILWSSLVVFTIILGSLFTRKKQQWGWKLRWLWCQVLWWILGIRIKKEGETNLDTFLLISNHRSYIDIVVTLGHTIANPVAKAEVSKWPIIGYGGKVSGIIFVKRESQSSRRSTRTAIEDALLKGIPILIYPEGTTNGEKTTLEFKKGVFEIAARHKIPVVPCAIDYANPISYWLGDDTFMPHFFRIFNSWRINATLNFGDPIISDNRDELARQTRAWIDERLMAGWNADDTD
jgi:1-acyl-sn-glycerol-3-phosphate acyltransferase